ncbi:MAG: YraN family protein [Phycisphaerales bacterium]
MLRALLEKLGLAARKPVGMRGEDAAAAFLKRAGYIILDRNVRVSVGEADIVARHDAPSDGRSTVVLVEVKTRVVDPAVKRPRAEEQVGAFKRRKLRAVMEQLVARTRSGAPGESGSTSWRSSSSRASARAGSRSCATM